MSRSRGVNILFKVASILIAAGSPTASFAGTTTLHCATGNDICYIAAFLKGTQQVRNLTLRGGETYDYSGVQAGDQFCIDTRAPNDPNTCSRTTLGPNDVKP